MSSRNQNNVDVSVIKKPGQDEDLTPEQMDEWMKCAEDPMYFFTNYCYVRGSRGKILFEPREYQEDLLNDVIDNTHVVAVSPRQSGKCSTASTRIKVKVDGEVRELAMGELHRLVCLRELDQSN